jgi:hypothetical protein
LLHVDGQSHGGGLERLRIAVDTGNFEFDRGLSLGLGERGIESDRLAAYFVFVILSLGTSNLAFDRRLPVCRNRNLSFDIKNSLLASFASTSPFAVATRSLMPAATLWR